MNKEPLQARIVCTSTARSGKTKALVDALIEEAKGRDINVTVEFAPNAGRQGETEASEEFQFEQRMKQVQYALPSLLDNAYQIHLALQGKSTSPVDERESAMRHLLWKRGDPRGYQPGSFVEALLTAWDRADPENSQRLHLAFPLYGQAIVVLNFGGVEGLVKWGEGK